MANTQSALKALHQSERRRARNRAIRSRTRTFVKKARASITGSRPEVEDSVRQAISALDRAVSKGVIQRNNAARRKSRLVRRLQAARAQQG